MPKKHDDGIEKIPVNSDEVVDIDTIIRRKELHLALMDAPESMTLNEAEAAFFLSCSPRTLEGKRGKRLPPPTWPHHAESKPVRYRVVDLLAYSRGEFEKPQITETWGMKNGAAVRNGVAVGINALAANKASTRKSLRTAAIAWIDPNLMAIDEPLDAFFVNDNGLVLAHGWEDDTLTVAERLISQSSTIQWMSWYSAIAGVWVQEERRLSWLASLEIEEPGFGAKVNQIRSDILARI